jgi:hypothetical protein
VEYLGTKVLCTLLLPCTDSARKYYNYFIWRVSCTLVGLTCFVMCGYFDNCVGVLVICELVFYLCVLVFAVYRIVSFMYIFFLFVLFVLG